MMLEWMWGMLCNRNPVVTTKVLQWGVWSLEDVHKGNVQGEAHKVLQSDSTQTIDHIQKCFRQKFQCSRRPSNWTTLFLHPWRYLIYVKVNSTCLNGTMYFFSMTLLPILTWIQRPATQGHSSHAKYENSRKIETCWNKHFQRIH